MSYRTLLLLFMLNLPLAKTQFLQAQFFSNPAVQATQPSDSTLATPRAIPLSDINEVSTESFNLYSRIKSEKMKGEQKKELEGQVREIKERETSFYEDTLGMLSGQLNIRELDQLRNAHSLLKSDIDRLQRHINDRISNMEIRRQELQFNRNRWQLTLSNMDRSSAPIALIRRVSIVLEQNDSISLSLSSDVDLLLTYSDELTSIQIKLDQFEQQLDQFTLLEGNRLFLVDSPSVWKMFGQRDSVEATLFAQTISGIKSDARQLVKGTRGNLILLVILILAIGVFVSWLKRTHGQEELRVSSRIKDGYLQEVFRHPAVVILLLACFAAWAIMPDLPITFSVMLGMVSWFAIVRISYDLFKVRYRSLIVGFALVYLLIRILELLPEFTPLIRIALIFIQVAAIYFLYQIGRFFIRSGQTQRGFSQTTSGILSYLFIIMLIGALVGNIFGLLSLAEFFTLATIKSGFLLVTVYVGFHVTLSLLFLFMNSGLFRESNILNQQFEHLFNWFYRVLRLVFVAAWVLLTLEQFTARETVLDAINEFLRNEISIGEASITLLNVLLFVFVIWLSMFISRILRHILNDEVFPRIEIERGLPGTIVMLMRIVLVTIGFILAAAAAGMQLSSLTIIIGAFSVGIGFGLQNIFNNLVSGLILAFERPIKEGDVVEVKNLLGVVLRIGIRSSVVRTYDGSEVIVPNGELISNEMINWTLSDDYRRAEILVGVAYGTDTEKVIQILLEVAGSHPKVNDTPQPRAYFIDFGESSLDFRLLAWINQDYRLEVESELRLSIDQKFREAGIEIPFPQRDVHIKEK